MRVMNSIGDFFGRTTTKVVLTAVTFFGLGVLTTKGYDKYVSDHSTTESDSVEVSDETEYAE